MEEEEKDYAVRPWVKEKDGLSGRDELMSQEGRHRVGGQ